MVLPLFHVYALTCCNLTLSSCQSGDPVATVRPGGCPKDDRPGKAHSFPGIPAMYAAINHSLERARSKESKTDLSSIRICFSGADRLPRDVQEDFERLIRRPRHRGLRPDGGLAGDAREPDARTATDRQHRPAVAQYRGAHHRPGARERRGTGRGGRAAGPRTAGHEGLLERTGGDRRRPSPPTAGCIPAMSPAPMRMASITSWTARRTSSSPAASTSIPREVEEVLAQFSKIKEVAVKGLPHKLRGEVVKAYVVLKENEAGNRRRDPHVSPGKSWPNTRCPRRSRFIDELPRSVLRKVLKRKLDEEENRHTRTFFLYPVFPLSRLCRHGPIKVLRGRPGRRNVGSSLPSYPGPLGNNRCPVHPSEPLTGMCGCGTLFCRRCSPSAVFCARCHQTAPGSRQSWRPAALRTLILADAYGIPGPRPGRPLSQRVLLEALFMTILATLALVAMFGFQNGSSHIRSGRSLRFTQHRSYGINPGTRTGTEAAPSHSVQL